jgi:hypothetical protein
MSPLTPILLVTVTAYGNDWYNGGSPANVKPLLYGGVAALTLGGFGAIPSMNGVATAIGWAAFAGYLLAGGAGKGTPVANLLKISGQGAK